MEEELLLVEKAQLEFAKKKTYKKAMSLRTDTIGINKYNKFG